MARTLVSPDLVGRETQVGQLLGALSRAKSGLPGIVLVRGEAGSGKSRLLREFLALARTHGATTLYGAGIDVSAGDIPLVPFRAALRHLVRSRSTTDMESLLGGTWRDLHVLLPELAPSDVHGAPSAPHVFEVVSAVVSRLAAERPVVLAVDDAQWADQSTLQLLLYLTQTEQRLPLLVLVAYRGEELPDEPGLRKAFEELSRAADDDVTVTPLTAEQVTDLVRGLGIELGTASLRRLLARSAGLPFLVEELAAAEQDGVTRGIPNRVRDVVRLRLGALSQDAQLLVALVAVAARPLRHRVLAEAAHLPPRILAAALDEALSAHLLVADTDERTYGFRHDVAREIVHDDLLTSSRLELHVRLAVALQADLPVDAYAGRLCEVAHHWLQTEANEEHALRASLLAARASTRAFAHPEALRQYEHVVVLWPRVGDAEMIVGADLVAVSMEAAEAGHWAGDAAAALRHIDRALGATDSTTDEDLLSTLHGRRTLYGWLGTGRLDRGPDLLGHIGSVAARERMRASDLMVSGQYGESVEVARTAVGLARAASSWREELRAALILGVGQAMSGNVVEGVPALDRVIEEATRRGDDELVVAAHINLAFVLLGDGQIERAADLALRGIDEAAARGASSSDGALLAANAAEALTRLGRLTQADRVIDAALEARPPSAVESVLLLGRAELDVLMGRLRAAHDALTTIRNRGVLDDYQFQQQLQVVQTELRLWDPDPSPQHRGSGGDGEWLGSTVAGAAGEDLPLTARLMWLGVRVDADAHLRAQVEDDHAWMRAVVEDARALADRARDLPSAAATDGVLGQLDRFLALIAGEESRLSPRPDPDVWQTAAELAAGDPYLHAYALWQQGSALRADRHRREAADCFRLAYDLTQQTGMRTLGDAIIAGGASLGLRIDEPAVPVPRQPKVGRPFGMTPKEFEVLELLVRGFTNRRIGTALHMTEKTASVHVSHILAKMAVSSRGEAVARAHALGVLPVRS